MKSNMIVILALGLALAQFNVGETGRRIVKYPWHNKLTIPDRATFMDPCQRCIDAITRFIDVKLSSHSILEKEQDTARSVICPINPNFPICTRNEAFQWESAIQNDEFAIQFCTTTPGACSDERLWDADTCYNDYHEWKYFFLRPTTKFQVIESIKNSFGSILGKGMDDNTWKQEVFYIIEMAIPAVIARNNNTEKVCNSIFKK